jgi:hypothetical protein
MTDHIICSYFSMYVLEVRQWHSYIDEELLVGIE